MSEEELNKKKILAMNYETMLELWRFSGSGHPYFQGELGDFFSKTMEERKAELSHDAKVAISKRVSFAKPRNQFGEDR